MEIAWTSWFRHLRGTDHQHLVGNTCVDNPPCSFVVAPLSFSVDANGALASHNDGILATVTPNFAYCTWTATSNNHDQLEKLTLGSQPTGNSYSVTSTGTGTFTFKVTVNNGEGARTGTISVAGATVTVTQAAK